MSGRRRCSLITADLTPSNYRAFDFDKDARFIAHINNIELPASDTAAALMRVKGRWYSKNVDPDFLVEWAAAAPSSKPAPQPFTSRSQPAAPSPSAPPPPSAAAPQQPSGASRWQGGGGGGGGGSGIGDAAVQSRLFLLHMAVSGRGTRACGLWVVARMRMVAAYSHDTKCRSRAHLCIRVRVTACMHACAPPIAC